jgi:ABC-type multidrug transport system fused ATPase/permease subunit
MEAGKLAAVGTHEELLEKSDLYRQLYDRQLVGVS